MTDTFEWRGRVGEAWAEEWRRTDRTLAPVQRGPARHPAAAAEGPTPRSSTSAAAPARPASLWPTRCPTRESPASTSPKRWSPPRANAPAAAPTVRGRRRLRSGSPPTAAASMLMVSRHGVMFFDDPVAAFAHLRALAAARRAIRLLLLPRPRGESGRRSCARSCERFAPEAGAPRRRRTRARSPSPIRRGSRRILAGAGFAPAGDRAVRFRLRRRRRRRDPVADAHRLFRPDRPVRGAAARARWSRSGPRRWPCSPRSPRRHRRGRPGPSSAPPPGSSSCASG